MAIFRGTGGSGNSTDDSIVSAVTTQAGIATTKAGEAATSATTASTKASEASASATTASTKATEASNSATSAASSATAASNHETMAGVFRQAAQDQANIALGHANTANNASVQTVAGISTEVQNVNNIRTEIQNVDTIKTDVTTVAGISSNVTTVAADASDIGTVATNIANVNNVGDNIANVNAVHSNASNINTVAADASDIGTVSSNISNVNTVAGISSDVTTVAGLESKMDTVIADASDIGAVANNIGDVTTVAGINSDVDTVAGIAAKVTTVADNITDVQNADTNAANASASASQAANSASAAGASASTASTKATEASNSATAASNSATTATTKATEAAGSATTATTKATEASTSATNAATSATTATTKASEAASSATAASGSATTATTKASEASVSAASAATSATDASNAENAWSSFYATYLGSYSAPPTVDVQGNALQTGAFYYDTGAGSNTVGLYVYNGSSWVYSTNYNNVTAPYSLSQGLATNSNNISFGDNAKANFGASNDLQIYHDSSNNQSYIAEGGLADLLITTNGAGIKLQKNTGENMIKALTDGAVTLYYDNQDKLSTTSTGINVTGTVTADGLTVDGNTTFNTANTLFTNFNYSGSQRGRLTTDGIDLNIEATANLNAKVNGANRVKFGGNGDISFYEDTGTTPKFFWDASTERLGIGTSSPSTALEVADSAPVLRLTDTRNLGNGSWDNVSMGALQFYTSDTTSPSARVGAEIEAFSGTGAASGPEFQLIFKTSSNLQSATERMRIDASGKVGIGTSNPSSKLTVVGDIEQTTGDLKYTGGINWDIAHHGAGQNIVFSTAPTGGSATQRMRITSDGNVGIGTSTVYADLQVHETSGAKLWITADGNNPSDAGSLRFAEQRDGFNYFEFKHDGSANKLFLDTTNGTLATFDRINQRVGIGKTPQYLLDVNGIANLQGDVAPTGNGLGIGDYGTTGGYKWIQSFSSQPLSINPLGNNVGIGTTTPATTLTVSGSYANGIELDRNGADATASCRLFFDSSTSGTAIYNYQGNTLFSTGATAGSSSGTERMRLTSSGNLLVGKTSADNTTAGCRVRGDGFASFVRSGAEPALINRLTDDGSLLTLQKDGTTVGSISVTSSATAYNTSSDERLKENIQDAEDAGSKIDAIQVRQFDWKSDGSHQDYGVVAQELLEVAPEAVSEGENEDDMMAVDYSKLVPTLIKEIQTLRNRVAQLENN